MEEMAELPETPDLPQPREASETPQGAGMRVIRGMGVSAGVAIGRTVIIETRAQDVIRLSIQEDEVGAEVARLHEAVEFCSKDLEKTRTEVGEDFGGDLAGIFDAHLLLL
ncbi:MAG TPA: phosphoenolpyruvate-utilizing N-terminal domain-containing protein, partial [Myxococcaceae bacterium]